MKEHFEMVVFDMIGTAIVDGGEVSDCFSQTAQKYKINIEKEQFDAIVNGQVSEAFRMSIIEKLGEEHPEIEIRTRKAYKYFRKRLEERYRIGTVQPTEGILQVFQFLKENKTKICLTTDLNRAVADIILEKLGWDRGLNLKKVGGKESVIDFSIANDEVDFGRPAPDMILKAMKTFKITNSKKVIKIGDTPADLVAGKAADCLLSLGMLGGSCSEEELVVCENDGLIETPSDLLPFLSSKITGGASIFIPARKELLPSEVL